MSYLKKLKSEAASLRDREKAEAEERQKRQLFYEQQMRPVLISLAKFLTDLVKDLNYVKPKVEASYTIGEHTLNKLYYSEYTSRVDSLENPKNLQLHIKCEGKKGLQIITHHETDAQKLNDHLFNNQVQYRRKRDRDESKIQYTFEIQPTITIRLTFSADIPASKIILSLVNFDRLGVIRQALDPKECDDNFMERLAEYLMRERDDLFKTDADPMLKAQYQALLNQEKLRQEKEIRQHEEEVSQLKRQGFFQKFRDR